MSESFDQIKTELFHEVNFDGLPGPSHLFSGLGHGNLASQISKGKASSPKQAALQSLEKIKKLYELGIKSVVVPPQRRPNLTPLSVFGFKGSREDIVEQAFNSDPKLFSSIFSSAYMWTANAATVSPSPDTHSGLLKLTVANLKTNFHRSIESFGTYALLRKCLSSTKISVSSPLAGTMPDEGAANHLRFCEDYGSEGLEVFVYGFSVNEPLPSPKNFKPRQSKEAFEKIIGSHEVKNSLLIFQNPDAIDAGVFHNDVISTSNKNVFLFHEKSFYKNKESVEQINEAYKKLTGKDLILLEVTDKEADMDDCVRTYLFNSQIINPGNQEEMMLIAPQQCKKSLKIEAYIDKILADDNNPISEVSYLDLDESMDNGGGPACLRLRVVMNDAQLSEINQKLIFNEELYNKLKELISNHYPSELRLDDLLEKETLEQLDTCFDKFEELFEIEL